MKFEEVLPLMREGKKARHAQMKENEYWVCAFISLPGSEKIPTITKVFDNPFHHEKTRDADQYSWGIERWAMMESTWEIVD